MSAQHSTVRLDRAPDQLLAHAGEFLRSNKPVRALLCFAGVSDGVNALLPFRGALLPIRTFSTNFSPDPADKLDTVRVPVVAPPSQSGDFAGSYTANPDSTVNVIPVSLNRHKFKTVHVTAREASTTALNVLDTLVSSRGEAARPGRSAGYFLGDHRRRTTAIRRFTALAAASFDYKKVLGDPRVRAARRRCR